MGGGGGPKWLEGGWWKVVADPVVVATRDEKGDGVGDLVGKEEEGRQQRREWEVGRTRRRGGGRKMWWGGSSTVGIAVSPEPKGVVGGTGAVAVGCDRVSGFGLGLGMWVSYIEERGRGCEP